VRRRVPLLVVLAGAAVVRLVVLTTTAARLSGDEAVTGIMARRITDGHHLAFYAGQAYMGTGEQYLQAVVLAALPDTDLTLRLVQVGLAVATCACVHAVARRCGLSERRALLAAAMFAVGPYFAVLRSVQSGGAYDLALLCGIAGVLVALASPGRGTAVGFGVVAGIGLWSNLQSGLLLVPAAWWLVRAARGRRVRAVATALAGFGVGYAPALGHLVLTGPLEVAGNYERTTVADRATAIVDPVLVEFLGVGPEGPLHWDWVPRALLVLLAFGALGAAITRRRRPWQRLDVLLLALVLAPVALAASRVTGTEPQPARVVFVLYAAVPILVAALPLPGVLRRRRWGADAAAALAVAALLAHTVAGVRRDIDRDAGGAATISGQRVRTEDLEPVVDALVAAGARTAYADYWLANTLEWVAGDRLLVESTYTKRFPSATRQAAADPSPALVVPLAEGDEVASDLRRLGSSFDRRVVAGWVLFTAVTPGQHPAEAFSVSAGLG
jgi:hypothetical protein